MKRLIFALIALLCSAVVSGQVNDQYFENKGAFKTFPQLVSANGSMVVKTMPSFNIDSLLEDDKELEERGGYPFRFGYAFDVNYTLEDGKWITDGDRSIWRMRFYSQGAYSLNYAFSELALSSEAELYVFSSDGSMVYGPVTATQNTTDGWLYTIPISGEDGIIQLIEPTSTKGQSRLTISQVIHGYKNVTPSQDGSPILSCYFDVCDSPAWTDYSDAVCRILVNGTAFCTGALMNNTSQNYTPYVLTANHCQEGEGATPPTSWTFQFGYKSCATAISYNYADVKSSWAFNETTEVGSDFLLVQLRSSLANQNLTFLGWDRTNTAPSSGTTLHHPGGAQMKLSSTSNSFSAYGYFWLSTFDHGSAERGSSGAPLFNPNYRVVGQMRGGPNIVRCPPVSLTFGRLDQSWTGNGTASSRLQDWLAPGSSSTQTLDLLAMFTIVGPSLVPCSGTVTYTIPRNITSVTWSTGSVGIQIVSGQGTNTITVQAVNSASASGNITVTFTFRGQTYTRSKAVSIGAPTITGISGPSTARTGSYVTYYAAPEFPASQGDYEWLVSPGTASKSSYRRMCDVTFNASGTYAVGVRSTSACTSPGSYTVMTVSVSSSYIVSSGTNKQVSVAISTLEGAPVVTDPNQTIAYNLYNQATGAFVTSGRISEQGGTLDFSFVPGGIYLLRLDAGNGTFDTHRILLK